MTILEIVLCYAFAMPLDAAFDFYFVEPFTEAVDGERGAQFVRALKISHSLVFVGAFLGLVIPIDLPAFEQTANRVEWATIETFGIAVLAACGYLDGWWVRKPTA